MGKIIKRGIQNDPPIILNPLPDAFGKVGGGYGDNGDRSIDLEEIIGSELVNWKNRLSGDIEKRRVQYSGEIEAAYEEGYRKGLADGKEREGFDRLKAIDQMLKESRRKCERAINGLEIKIINLAVLIAEKIVRKSIEADPAVILSIIEDAMSHLIGSETVVLKVSHEDFPAVNERYDRWLAMSGSAREFRIEVDKRLRRGDSVVETEGGVIDAMVSERMDIIVNEMLKASG